MDTNDKTQGLVVYKASAGSGKTFTLSVEYIEMVLRDTAAYKRILAVTFTNKATIEMKTRILSQLYGLAHGLDSSVPYREVLKERNGDFTDDYITERASRAFTSIINDYSNFRIETIDAFFQRVLKQLAHELRLSTSFNIELDSTKALDEAVDSMLENLHNDGELLKTILRYIEERMTDDKGWKIDASIKGFSRHIFDETYATQQTRPTHQTIERFKLTLAQQRKSATETISQYVAEFDDLLRDNGLSASDFMKGERGPCGFFIKLGKGVMSDSKFDTSTYKDAMNVNDPDKWVSKKSPDTAKQLAPQLAALMRHADKARTEANSIINTIDLASKDINNLSLLENISATLKKANEEKNRFLLADTNSLLREVIGDDDPSFIYEKLGNYIEHIMIDEFQDTSTLQWENFSKLLKESLANGKHNLIVGDVKQSIYRWRGGDWNILNSRLGEDIAPFKCEEKNLATNRRSEENLVTFNNTLFESIVSAMGLPKLTQAYSDVRQDLPAGKARDKGHVKVVQLGMTPDETPGDNADERQKPDYVAQTLEQLTEEIRDLLSHGLRQKDICILVRRRNAIREIADHISSSMPEVTLISEEAFRLGTSHAISIVISALRYLNDSNDHIAMAQLATDGKTCRQWNETLLSDHEGLASTALPPEFVTRYDELRAMPLYETTVNLARIFKIFDYCDEQAYISTFMDLVKDSSADDGTDIPTFLKQWDESLSARTVSAGSPDGIRIMTIHKSKGLQAHTILLPFCDWSLTTESHLADNIVWCNNPIAESGEGLDILPVSYGKRMAESRFAEAYEEETEQMNVDSINLLYVALTRAEKNMVIITREKANTVGEQILMALGSDSMKRISQSLLPTFEVGERIYKSKDKSGETSDNPLTTTPHDLTAEMKNAPMRINFRQSNKSEKFMMHGDVQQQEYIDRGVVMHQLFSSLATGSEAEIDKAVCDIWHQGLFKDARQKDEAKSLAIKRIASVACYGWFDSGNRLYNECNMIYCDARGDIQQCRPDRVIVKDDTVTVVDFKFGKPHNEHREQVQHYKELLAKVTFGHKPAGGMTVKGYLWYVYENKIIEV